MFCSSDGRTREAQTIGFQKENGFDEVTMPKNKCEIEQKVIT